MGLVRDQVEKKLSAAIGMNVSFEKLNFSLLGGSVEAQGVTVSTGDPSTPLLTIARVRAEISLTAALKKEFVVKSLTIEKPVVTLIRDKDGTLNLPNRPMPADTSDSVADKSPTEDGGGSWKLDAKKLLVVDAEVHYRDATGYHASAEQLLAELKQTSDATFELTVLADSVARRDIPTSVGPLKVNAVASNVPSLMQWRNVRLAGSFDLGDLLRGKFEVPTIKPFDVKTELQGAFNLDFIRKLLPSR